MHLVVSTPPSQSSKAKLELRGIINTQFCQAPSSDSFGSEYSDANNYFLLL